MADAWKHKPPPENWQDGIIKPGIVDALIHRLKGFAGPDGYGEIKSKFKDEFACIFHSRPLSDHSELSSLFAAPN